MNAPALRGRGCEFLSGNRVVVEQYVSVSLQLVSLLSLGTGSGPVVVVVWYVFCGLWSLSGASSNFLALKIKANKTIRFSCALWGTASSEKEGLRKWLLSS